MPSTEVGGSDVATFTAGVSPTPSRAAAVVRLARKLGAPTRPNAAGPREVHPTDGVLPPAPNPLANIPNPKRKASTNQQHGQFFDYYAGYSPDFVRAVLSQFASKPSDLVLDPWNGAGTTTTLSAQVGHMAMGIDLNPAMVVVAKARLASSSDVHRVGLLLRSFRFPRRANVLLDSTDPLLTWFSPLAARALRTIISHFIGRSDSLGNAVDHLSPADSFFLVCIFKTVRVLLASFVPSNPTWITEPKSSRNRLKCSQAKILKQLRDEFQRMVKSRGADTPADLVRVMLGDATAMRLPADSISFVLGSPPYCTRIDYAVATKPELAILGFGSNAFQRLRRSLIGTTLTVPGQLVQKDAWGKTCIGFLEQVKAHRSHASATYYLSLFLSYFDSTFSTLKDIQRVLRPECPAVLVLQDSSYKDVHLPLQDIFIEMARAVGLQFVSRRDFTVAAPKALMNRHWKKYARVREATESILLLRKESTGA